MKTTRSFGFTLVEVLIVVGILGILSGLSIMILDPAGIKGKARDGVRVNDLAVVKGALEQYYAEHNIYPAQGTFTFGVEWVGYLKSVPKDPLGTDEYCYQRPAADTQNYVLCATMEDGRNDKNAVTGCGTHCLTNPF
jgi:prepilin-type N-terminal cleavage/methylation domain-containing protein